MAIFVSDKFDSYKFKEWTKTFDSSASTSTQASTDDWTIHEVSSGGGGTAQFATDPIFSRGGYGRFTRAGGYEVSVSRQTTDDLTQYGRTYVSFTVAGSTPSGWFTNTRYGNAYGNINLYLIDSLTNLTSGSSTATLPSGAGNNQLIASASGTADQDKSGIGWFMGHITLKIESNQVTIYNNLVGWAEEYVCSGGTNTGYSIVSDGTVVNTSGWSGSLYLYLVYRCGDTDNYNSNKVLAQVVRSPLFLSNKPFGGSGGF